METLVWLLLVIVNWVCIFIVDIIPINVLNSLAMIVCSMCAGMSLIDSYIDKK